LRQSNPRRDRHARERTCPARRRGRRACPHELEATHLLQQRTSAGFVPTKPADATLPCSVGVPVPTHTRRVSGRSRPRAHCLIICPIKRTRPPCTALYRRGDSRRGVVGASAYPPSCTRPQARPFPERALSHAAFEPCRSLHSSRVSHLLGARMDPRKRFGRGSASSRARMRGDEAGRRGESMASSDSDHQPEADFWIRLPLG